MPANLSPKYHSAEKRYREAKDPDEKLDALEEMMAIMPRHKDFAHQLKYAVIWSSAKFDNQRVGRDHVLADGDIVEFHI